MEILHKSSRKEKINQKLKDSADDYVDSHSLSTENLHRKNRKKRKREEDNSDTLNIKKKINGDTSIEFLNDSNLKIKKEKIEINGSDEKNKQDIINVHTKKKKKKSIVNEVFNSSFDESYYNNIDILDNEIKKKIKTELEIIDLKPDDKFKSDILDDEHRKKRKKKHKEHESLISSVDKSYCNDLNSVDVKKKKIKVEHADAMKHEKEDDVNSYDIDILHDSDIKKKKKKKEKKDNIEELDQCSIKNNEETTKKMKIEPKDFNDKELQLEKNFQSFDVNNSGDDSLNKKKKKKKKHKHLDIEDIFSSDVLVKSEVSNTNTDEKSVGVKNKPDNCLSTKLHSKKARVKVEHENSDSDNIDYYLRKANVESSKKKKKESKVEVSIDNIEDFKKNKIKKHKRIENYKIEKGVRELEEENETKNHIEKGNDVEFTSEEKSKKKKHKKSTRESIQLDVAQEINTENTEFAEPQRKKKKKKKHSEELPEESLNEPVHLDLDFVSNYEDQDKEDISENYKKKKMKKHKHKENEIEVKNQIVNNSSNKQSTKKRKSRRAKSVAIVEDKFSDDSSDCEVSSLKNSKTIEDKSSDDNIDCNKSKSKKAKKIKDKLSDDLSSSKKSSLNEEKKMKNKSFNDNSDCKKNSPEKTKIVKGKSFDENSDFESEEGDYSESEITPQIHNLKSIHSKCPKVARMMKESDDDDDDLPHLQHRKLTLSEAMQLANMKIEVRHEIPPQHQVEKYSGTHTLTAQEKAEFGKYIQIKQGRFNCEEDRKIVHNWKKFCKRHNWKRSIIFPFLHRKRTGFFFATPAEERKKFVQILAKGLPNRTLYSVYFRFRNLYATHKKTRYSKAEDEMILSEHKDLQGRNKFWALARKLNRTRASVWRRYQLLIKKTKGSDSEDETNV